MENARWPLVPIPAPFPGERCCWMSSICFLTTCHSSSVCPFSWHSHAHSGIWDYKHVRAHTHAQSEIWDCIYNSSCSDPSGRIIDMYYQLKHLYPSLMRFFLGVFLSYSRHEFPDMLCWESQHAFHSCNGVQFFIVLKLSSSSPLCGFPLYSLLKKSLPTPQVQTLTFNSMSSPDLTILVPKEMSSIAILFKIIWLFIIMKVFQSIKNHYYVNERHLKDPLKYRLLCYVVYYKTRGTEPFICYRETCLWFPLPPWSKPDSGTTMFYVQQGLNLKWVTNSYCTILTN